MVYYSQVTVSNLMSQRGRGALEVKPSNSPFFVSTTSEHGLDLGRLKRVEWAGAINPEFARSAKVVAARGKQETFAFLYTRESDSYGGRVPKPAIDRPKMLTKTEFLKHWREKRVPADGGEVLSELLPEPEPTGTVDVERVLESWKQGTKAEDPRYTTTNNELGKKAPTAATIVRERFSIPQGFSSSFNGVKPQNSGLNVGLSKSNVHPSLDPQFA